MKKTLHLTPLLLLSVILCFGQNKSLDSLKKRVDYLKKMPKSYPNDTTLIGALNQLATTTFRTDQVEKAIPIAKEALEMSQKIKWELGILNSLRTLVSAENISNHHYDAIQNGLVGLALSEKIKNRYFEVFFLRSLGNNYDMLDNYTKAVPYYEACVKKSENLVETLPIRANVLVELGDAYRYHLQQPQKAKQLIEEAIKIYKKVNIASIGYAYDYLGQVLTDLRQYPEAEKAFKLSRAELEKNKKYYLIPELLVHTSQLYLSEKKYLEAQKYAKEAQEYSKKMGTIYGESEAFKILYLANKNLNNSTQALKYYELYTILRDSLTQVNMNSKFSQIQAEFETQKQKDQINQLKLTQKNQEIEKQSLIQSFLIGLLVVLGGLIYWIVKSNNRLRQKNQEINQALLRGQTIERKRVASELHDSLGGLLSAVKLTMQTIHVEDLSKPEQKIYRSLIAMVNDAGQQIRTLSHNLLPDELEQKGLIVSLENLVSQWNQAGKTHFHLTVSGLSERLEKNIEFNLYTICLELCNNILKHAEATEAQIDLIQKGKWLQLFVSDNGRGFSLEDMEEGRGLKNLQERAKSLNAKLNIRTTSNEGTLMSLNIPLSKSQLV